MKVIGGNVNYKKSLKKKMPQKMPPIYEIPTITGQSRQTEQT